MFTTNPNFIINGSKCSVKFQFITIKIQTRVESVENLKLKIVGIKLYLMLAVQWLAVNTC